MSSSGALAISFDLRTFLWVAGHRRLFQARQNGDVQELYACKVPEIKTLEQSDKVELVEFLILFRITPSRWPELFLFRVCSTGCSRYLAGQFQYVVFRATFRAAHQSRLQTSHRDACVRRMPVNSCNEEGCLPYIPRRDLRR
jgi:hypothetical protein